MKYKYRLVCLISRDTKGIKQTQNFFSFFFTSFLSFYSLLFLYYYLTRVTYKANRCFEDAFCCCFLLANKNNRIIWICLSWESERFYIEKWRTRGSGREATTPITKTKTQFSHFSHRLDKPTDHCVYWVYSVTLDKFTIQFIFYCILIFLLLDLYHYYLLARFYFTYL